MYTAALFVLRILQEFGRLQYFVLLQSMAPILEDHIIKMCVHLKFCYYLASICGVNANAVCLSSMTVLTFLPFLFLGSRTYSVRAFCFSRRVCLCLSIMHQILKTNQIRSNLFAQIYHLNIGSSKSVHEQGQQGWKQH